MTDVALYAKGAASYRDLKEMTPREFQRFQKRLQKYYEEKAKAADMATKR